MRTPCVHLSGVRLITYAKENNVDYIVAWNRELFQEKDLKSLTDPNTIYRDLNQEMSIETPEGNMVVYSIK